MKNYADQRECYPPRPKLRAIFKIFGQYNTRKRELKQLWKGGSRCIFYDSKTSVLSLKIYDTNFAMKGSVKNMVFHKFSVWNIINKVKNAVSF